MTDKVMKAKVKEFEAIHKMFDELVECQDAHELEEKLSTIRWRMIGKFKSILSQATAGVRGEFYKVIKEYDGKATANMLMKRLKASQIAGMSNNQLPTLLPPTKVKGETI